MLVVKGRVFRFVVFLVALRCVLAFLVQVN